MKAPLTGTKAALKYRLLWQVECCFREAQALLRMRPVYHRRDETIRGHRFCTLLAVVVKRGLELRMERAGIEAEWAVVAIVRCLGAQLPPAIRLLDGAGSARGDSA